MSRYTTVWRLMAHHADPEYAVERTRERGRIAMGWGRIGDLSRLLPSGAREVSRLIAKSYAGVMSNAITGGPSVWNIYKLIKPKDLVILAAPRNRLLVVRVAGPYRYIRERDRKLNRDDRYYHHRPVSVVDNMDPDELWERAGARPARGQGVRWTLFRCAEPVKSCDLK